jgi:hypothetical protein
LLITSKEAGMAYPHETDETGVVTRKNVDADQAAGDPEEVQAVTGRANDLGSVTPKPALDNSTFAARAKARQSATTKAVEGDEAENKAVKRSRKK